jgi:ribosomal protein S6
MVDLRRYKCEWRKSAIHKTKDKMSESNMPAVEAVVETGSETQAYELAFHVLPTIAEGEVKGVVDALKAHITSLGGTITIEEAPARFDLAYEIVKHLEGRNRKFASAYFGWVRFTLEAGKIAELQTEIDHTKEVLRYMVIRLTKTEEENPFYFHPAIASRVVETVVIEAEGEEGVEVEAEGEVEADAEAEQATDGEATEETV